MAASERYIGERMHDVTGPRLAMDGIDPRA